MQDACLSTGVAGIGDTSHDAMACLPRFLVMQAHAAGIVRAAGSSGILAAYAEARTHPKDAPLSPWF
jgi:hypothetical protein